MSDLAVTALALEATHDRKGWGRPARLYGIDADQTWVQADEGDPHVIVDRFTMLPGEDFVAIALVCEGWASPPGGRRPSRHPQRCRVRIAAVVSRDGSRISVLRRKGEGVEVIAGGGGALMDRLAHLWTRVAAEQS
jgi:hypothetical protein